ncbi:hypothetical protein NQ314_003271 [Rhamnusium bicolor]|uniref:Uncharacterized protein n=1 Tax=Rhamnusium bicolor TaxID=1586634 RepID=A0AAV8ZQ50_9CUCU|nr:hypothetical protein NQ314_003271 [Rhamnusium bicolor]
MVIDNDGIKLYANCLDNTIYCYNVGTYSPEPVIKYLGHQNNTFYVKSSLSKNGNYLISGSSDENAYIWNTKHSQPLVKLTGHTAEVTCVAWCNKNNSLITCSDDMTHKIWNVGPEEFPENWENYGRGFAEILPVENEPVRIKRHLAFQDVSENTPKRFFLECERCSNATSSLRFCENCNITSSKRKNSCDLVSENKRVQTEFGPRRLFASVNHNIPVKEDVETLAKSLDTNGEQKCEEYEPPSKMPKVHCSPTTSKSTDVSSPTVNLPNYIVDGTAPHLNYSPPKKKRQDWLTKIRIEKNLRMEMYDKTVGPSTPKVPKLETPSRTKRPSSPKSPLLRFFKVTNSSTHKCGCTNALSSNMQPS